MTRKVWFQFGVGILLTLLIIKYFIEINWILEPLLIIAKTIFVPLLLGAVLFYITEPIQRVLEKYRVPRWGSILLILISAVGAIWLFLSFIGPPVGHQVDKLAKNTPTIAKEITNRTEYILQHREDLPPQVNEAIDKAANSVQSIAVVFGKLIVSFFQSVLQATFTLILVPFFFIFMLKDHEKLSPFVCKFFTGEKKAWVQKTLGDMNTVLRTYIQGQLLISFLLAVIMYIGYLIIGLEYALLLVIFAFFMNVIPFIGPWIAFIPALIIGFLQDPMMVIWVSLVTLIAQQTDSNLITPNVMGKTLDIHPLTVITIILAAGNIAGFFGILLAIPGYAVGKVIISNIYERRKEIKLAATKSV
ncbi:AI-2E family transporter [Sporosarcina pasteurii]|uniref:Pheromone autoinducer 2 transporter n=1 Tax=Sporosarcina pasteurii TaxID=1474 RepID=A0A380BBN5_SPOPA|nr:AI-2E family transporter [Sporosarcina pasteurii]MDS9472878.1 AI-2E family transporter [Sporosarcina pasteurii]QBQ06427.1 AI-2E family transporter [Sporosarcina pasteurii]SUI98530.1 pheromone autoinducer 2 transporter [Sporosarcina pasteurii]